MYITGVVCYHFSFNLFTLLNVNDSYDNVGGALMSKLMGFCLVCIDNLLHLMLGFSKRKTNQTRKSENKVMSNVSFCKITHNIAGDHTELRNR